MHPLEQEIQQISQSYQQGQLSAEERNYLLEQIRDIRAAQECAGNEVMFRHFVDTCNIAMAII